ncbi:MAG TPA: hypothetical protein VGB76_14390 [Pyrinomonadaceae bacterium]|jgi:hypothetical protein
MSDRKYIPAIPRARLTAIFVSLILSAAIVGSLTVWSALARQRGQEEAMLLSPASLPSAENDPAAASGAGRDAREPSSGAPPALQSISPSAFTISWERTETSADGHSRLLRTTTRYQRSDGLYKLVQIYPAREDAAGHVETYYGYVGLGLFRLDETQGRLVFVASQSDERSEDVEAALRSDPRFDREEDVRGQRALVMRTVGEDEAAYKEEFHAPALGGLLVRRVEHSAIRREVWEPTGIEFGEPAASLFADIDRNRPDYTHYEREIQKTQRDPQQRRAAQVMRELMARMRAVRPDAR